MSASRPVTTPDVGVLAPSDEHSLPVGANGPLRAANDDFGKPYTLWEKFLIHTDASAWPATSPATPARTRPASKTIKP
jgi:hypothetical protein